MTWSRSLWILCLICGALPASASDPEMVDLTKIPRTLAKEPQYSQPPRYCLLVFGMKADTRVWLVLDGATLYVDRNGDGDLTEANEAIKSISTNAGYSSFQIDRITASSGKVYSNLRVNETTSGFGLSITVPENGTQMVGFGQAAKPEFSVTAKDAPIIHFDGPLSLTQYSEKRIISRQSSGKSDRDRALRIMIGTAGLGAGTFAASHCKMCNSHGPMSVKFEYRSDNGDSQIELTEPLLKIG